MKTVKPGDDFYMYALGTWFNSHTEGDRGYMEYYDAINSNEVEKSLFASDNPLARHLVRNIEAPAPSLSEDVKAVLDYLDIQKPTGIGMLLTEIGKLQDKGLNPIFSKRVDMHMQTHSCQEIVSRGIQAKTVDYFLGIRKTDVLKSYIKHILRAWKLQNKLLSLQKKIKNSGGRYECRAPAPGLGRKNLVLYGVMC